MNHNTVISLPVAASTTISAFLRVKVGASAKVAAADAADTAIGTNLQDIDSTVVGRDIASVQLLNGGGIHYATYGTSTALSQGDPIVAADGGKVTKGAVSPIGVALESASASGDVIRVLYF